MKPLASRRWPGWRPRARRNSSTWRASCRACGASWAWPRSRPPARRRCAASTWSCRNRQSRFRWNTPCCCTSMKNAHRCTTWKTPCSTPCSACSAGTPSSPPCPAPSSTPSTTARRTCSAPTSIHAAPSCSPPAWRSWTATSTRRASAVPMPPSRACCRPSSTGATSTRPCWNRHWPACRLRS
ncbi:hypothetical protein D3C84_574910 [compost metagenome]